MRATDSPSTTPLVRKLGIGTGAQVLLLHAPPDYLHWLHPLPDGVCFGNVASTDTDLVHLFCDRQDLLQQTLLRLRSSLRPDAVVWVSWPKRASGVPTDVSEDVIRAICLPQGWVDVKVCAVNAVWSGLKLVVRKALR